MLGNLWIDQQHGLRLRRTDAFHQFLLQPRIDRDGRQVTIFVLIPFDNLRANRFARLFAELVGILGRRRIIGHALQNPYEVAYGNPLGQQILQHSLHLPHRE